MRLAIGVVKMAPKTREDRYREWKAEQESVRNGVAQLMAKIWSYTSDMTPELQRRLLNGMITELQVALKES